MQWPMEVQSNAQLDETIQHESDRLQQIQVELTKLVARAREIRADTLALHSSSSPMPHITDGVRIVTLSDASEQAIRVAIMGSRIRHAEAAVLAGRKDLEKTLNDADVVSPLSETEPYQETLFGRLRSHMPIPAIIRSAPRAHLSLAERKQRVREISADVAAQIQKLRPGTRLTATERQDILRRYLGLLSSNADEAIAAMDSPLPRASEIDVDTLVRHNVTIRDLVGSTCNIKIGELFDAGIVRTISDLQKLSFDASVLGSAISTFSVSDFVVFFNGSYAALCKHFGFSLRDIPLGSFTVGQLHTLKFKIDSSHTVDDIRKLNLKPADLVQFGLTEKVLKHQLRITTKMQYDSLRWTQHDMRHFHDALVKQSSHPRQM